MQTVQRWISEQRRFRAKQGSGVDGKLLFDLRKKCKGDVQELQSSPEHSKGCLAVPELC